MADEFARDVPPPAGMTEEDLEKIRAWRRRIAEERARNPPEPTFEGLVLDQLRLQTDLLREIRDRLGGRPG